MFYKPESGCMWDPTVLYRNGFYYMVSMYKPAVGQPDHFMWLAKSADGVHWEGMGSVLEDPAGVCKMYLYETDDGVMANFGSFSRADKRDNDTLRYYRSDDMVHWEYVGEDHPNPRWYHATGRWDHMYVYRDGDGTYYGYPVATPLPQFRSAWGLCKSRDGRHWECCEPPVIEWGDIPCINCLEGGGMEKIGGKYYYIGGFVGYAGNYGYGLFTFVADHPEGPFRPDKEAFRLCGFDRLEGRVFVQNLAAFARGKEGELLISNAVDAGGAYEIWLLPLRKAVVDEAGHLRLGYWEGNDQVKGPALPITKDMQLLAFATNPPGKTLPENWNPTVFQPREGGLCANVSAPNTPVVQDRNVLVLLQEKLDLAQGIVMEGKLKAVTYPVYDEQNHATNNWRPASFGIFLEEEGESLGGMAVTLEIGHPYKRYSHVENIRIAGETMVREIVDTIGEGCAEVKGIDAGREVSFRLLYRRNVFELYVDDLLVQTFVHLGKPAGRVGICLQNAKIEIEEWQMYRMNI